MKKKDITVFAFTVSLVLIGVGIYFKQPASVLAKAVRICMECVGLG